MAKDDYYAIVAKILVYLYKKYKCIDIDDNYIRPRSEAFPIEEKQLFELNGGQKMVDCSTEMEFRIIDYDEKNGHTYIVAEVI